MSGAVGRIEFRVRYCECDPMGVAHHTAYPVWFEMGRTELLRDAGMSYRDLESEGTFIAVASMSVRYRRPARYDDRLELRTRVAGAGRAKIDHRYELYRDGVLLTTAETTVVCLDAGGRPQPLPERLARIVS